MPVVTVDTTVQSAVNKALDLTAKKAGDLALATVHLFTNAIDPTPQSVVGDFTEATFTGYVAKAIAGWNANRTGLDGSVAADGTGVLTWVGPSDGSGETILGYYVLSAGGGTPIIYACRFPNPVGLATALDVLALVPTFRLP